MIEKIFQKFLTKIMALAFSGALLLPLFSSASWGMKEEEDHIHTATVLNTTPNFIKWRGHLAYEAHGPYFLIDKDGNTKSFDIFPWLSDLFPREETDIKLGLPDRFRKIYGVTTLPDGVNSHLRALAVKPLIKWDKLFKLPSDLRAIWERAEDRDKYPDIAPDVMDADSVVITAEFFDFPVNSPPAAIYPLEELITPEAKLVIEPVSLLPESPPLLMFSGYREDKFDAYEGLKAKVEEEKKREEEKAKISGSSSSSPSASIDFFSSILSIFRK